MQIEGSATSVAQDMSDARDIARRFEQLETQVRAISARLASWIRMPAITSSTKMTIINPTMQGNLRSQIWPSGCKRVTNSKLVAHTALWHVINIYFILLNNLQEFVALLEFLVTQSSWGLFCVLVDDLPEEVSKIGRRQG